MAAIITAGSFSSFAGGNSSVPVQLLPPVSPIAVESDVCEMFGVASSVLPRIEPGNTLFDFAGWNTVFFHTPTPITFSSYAIWLAQDNDESKRCAAEFKLLTGTSIAYNSINTIIDDVTILQGYDAQLGVGSSYINTYGSSAIEITNTFSSITASFFAMQLHGIGSGISTLGPRVCGLQLV